MYSVAKKDDPDAIAAAWIIRLDRGDVTEQERREFDAWVGEHSRNRGAFVRAQSIWADVDRIAALDAGRAARTGEPTRWSRHRVATSLAACLVVASVLASWIAVRQFAGREATQLGEIRRLLLQDGSGIVLNVSSVVQVKFQPLERRVVLREGEASFTVAHNAQRPFIVQAGDVSVRAVGTSFAVRVAPDAVSVTVTEGVVEITRPGDAAKDVEVIGRNRQLIASRARPMSVAALSNQEVTRRMSWQEGLLVFDGQQLAQAVDEVNRYSVNPIVIDGERLGKKTFVGVFRVGDARAFVDAAAAAFDAHVIEQRDGLHLAD